MASQSAPLDIPLVAGRKTPADVTRDICHSLEGKPTPLWWGGFFVALSLLALGLSAVSYEIATGIGTWGVNRTVGWAVGITCFVFWVGIGHAGTLISAILFLLRQRWRTAVNRFSSCSCGRRCRRARCTRGSTRWRPLLAGR